MDVNCEHEDLYFFITTKFMSIFVQNISDTRLEMWRQRSRIKMFLSLKRKFSSAILNALILLAFLIFCYLGKQVINWDTQEDVNCIDCILGLWPLPAVPEGRQAADLPDRAGGADSQHWQAAVWGPGGGWGLSAGQLCNIQQSKHKLETWQMKQREIVYLWFVTRKSRLYQGICRKSLV